MFKSQADSVLLSVQMIDDPPTDRLVTGSPVLKEPRGNDT